MKCSLCNIEFDNDLKYCCHCGRELKQEITVAKCFDVFAVIGFIMGLVSLVLAAFFGIGIYLVVPGIVFSTLGKKSINDRKKAKAGLIISIISAVINFIVLIIMAIITYLCIGYFLIYMLLLLILGAYGNSSGS